MRDSAVLCALVALSLGAAASATTLFKETFDRECACVVCPPLCM